MFYLYILQSTNYGTYYVGVTKNIQQRLYTHNKGMVKSTKSKKPWNLLRTEEFENLNEARKRELYLKSLKKRKYLEDLIKHF